MRFEYFIGFRYLLSKKNAFLSLITAISILGIILGVTALTVVVSVMQGFEYDLKDKILGNSPHIRILKFGGPGIPDYEKVVGKIRNVRGVNDISPTLYREGMVISEAGLTGGVLIKGIIPESTEKLLRFSQNIKGENKTISIQEALINKDDIYPPVIIGKELANDLLVEPGELISVLSPEGEITPFGSLPKIRKFRVEGIFTSGFWEFDSKFIFAHISSVQRLFAIGNLANVIEVSVDNLDETFRITNKITTLLGDEFFARDWTQTHKSLFSALKLEKTTMFVILTMIILVAAFNIVAMLIMIVIEKGRDISILKSMGVTTKSIMLIFKTAGMFIGIVGTTIGLVLGYTLCFLLQNYIRYPLNPEVYLTDTLPVKVDPINFIMIAVCSLLICYIATLYPSYRAAKLDPVEGLRYE